MTDARREATEIFKLGLKASKAGIHRTLNRAPKGKGWVQCVNAPAGLMCRPEKVRESIELFVRAYQTFPDIVALNQIALGHEMLASARRLAPTSRACGSRRSPRTSRPTSRRPSPVSLAWGEGYPMPIWPFRSKQPKLQDEALADLAEMFLSNPDDPTPGGESLDRARFDYAIESLRAVDDHLEGMRARGLEGEAMMKFVLRCGAYVGEVIRRHSPTGTAWHWVTYADAVRLDARLGSIGQSLGTAAVFWDGQEGFCFPLGKVGKYLENGAEDSVWVFAQAIIARARGGA